MDALASIGAIIERHPKVAETHGQARSELASDDALTSPLHTSHLVTYTQSVAIDNLKALRALILDGDGLTLYQVAQYPLLRSAIEASAEVIWLLGPNDQRERVRRLLVARASEFTYDRRLVLEAGAVREQDEAAMKKTRARMRQDASRSHRANLADLRRVAARVGVAESEFLDADLPWTEIVGYASELALQPAAEVGVTIWRAVSGLTHPSSSRALMLAVFEEDGPRVGDRISARVSASAQNVASTTVAALALLRTSERLIRYRKVKVAGDAP